MIRAGFASALLVLVPVLASAQGLGGPFAGLFGRVPERIGKEMTAVDFRASLGAQYDDTLLDGTTPEGLAPSGVSTGGVTAGLGFEHRGGRMMVSGYGNATHQQVFKEPPFASTAYDTGAIARMPIADRLSLDANLTYRRSPFFHVLPAGPSLLPIAEVLVPGDTDAARRLDNDTLDATLGFSSPYSKRSTLSGSVSHRATRFFAEPDNNFEVWGARGQWSRKLTRDVGVHMGYGREQIRETALSADGFVHETIDIGFDLARALSLARRTTVTFNAQPSVVRETGGERRYRLNGGLAIMRGFQRSWMAAVAANRSTDFRAGFVQPIYADNVSGTLSGMPWSRLEWSASLAASRGQVGADSIDRFTTYSGNSRLSAGVTRHLGVYAQYDYSRYQLPSGSTTIALLPALSRQAISIGLSAYAPLFSRIRTPRDPR